MISLAATVALTVGVVNVAGSGAVEAVADDDWLGVVNTYRAMSNLDPVSGNATWSAQAQAHSCYMLLNGIAHDPDTDTFLVTGKRWPVTYRVRFVEP